MTVAGGGINSGAAIAAEHELRVGEGYNEKIGGHQEGEEDDEGEIEEGEEGEEEEEEEADDEDGEEKGEEEGGDKEGEGEGEKEEDDEDEDGDGEGRDGNDDDEDDDDERISPSEQDEDEDAWEDMAYESLARNLGRRRRRYLISKSSQVLKGNLQKLGGLI